MLNDARVTALVTLQHSILTTMNVRKGPGGYDAGTAHERREVDAAAQLSVRSPFQTYSGLSISPFPSTKAYEMMVYKAYAGAKSSELLVFHFTARRRVQSQRSGLADRHVLFVVPLGKFGKGSAWGEHVPDRLLRDN